MDLGGEYLESRKLHNEGLRTLRACCFRNISRVITSKRTRMEGQLTWNVVTKPVRQRSHGISRRRGQIDFKMYKTYVYGGKVLSSLT
jgi:hypothetical protein